MMLDCQRCGVRWFAPTYTTQISLCPVCLRTVKAVEKRVNAGRKADRLSKIEQPLRVGK